MQSVCPEAPREDQLLQLPEVNVLLLLGQTQVCYAAFYAESWGHIIPLHITQFIWYYTAVVSLIVLQF